MQYNPQCAFLVRLKGFEPPAPGVGELRQGGVD